MKELYVASCCRTAVGAFQGSLSNTPAAELGAVVVKAALERAGLKPENVDELMFGCILTAAQGQNVARQVGVKAGLPYSVPAYTVGMVCGSGMKSVIEAARAILAGDADVVVCGGTENMTMAPYAVPTARGGARMFNTTMVDTMVNDGLWDAFNNYHMGTTAENICDIWGITREELDEFAASSQQKTEAAQKAGRFEDEIVPVMVKKKKEMVEFKVDEFPKAGVTKESVAKLRGAFPVGPESIHEEVVHTFELTAVNGEHTKKHVQRVTAANASGINDGAAAIVLCSGEAVTKYGLKPMATLVSAGLGGVLTPTGVGTIVEDNPYCLGKQTINGKDYLLMAPIHADFAVIAGYKIDKAGNVWYKGTTSNFNIVMATAADTVIAEAEQVVEIGGIAPEDVRTSGVFVDYVVEGGLY